MLATPDNLFDIISKLRKLNFIIHGDLMVILENFRRAIGGSDESPGYEILCVMNV